MRKRIEYIDFLKVVGLTGIIIAHIHSPGWALTLRTFDVPLMVLLSATLARISYSRRRDPKAYWMSRIKRLLVPTWLFLAFYFTLEYMFGVKHEFKTYVASFLLTRYGIGYVWIILIYLYSAMMIPLFDRWKNYPIGGGQIVAAVYILYEIAYYAGLDNHKLLDTTIFYIIPYGALTFLGYHYCEMSDATKKRIILISLSLFCVAFVYYYISSGQFQRPQYAKYPPRLYYLSYGIAVSFSLMFFCERVSLKIYRNPVVKFISLHSMEIYLWHILALKIIDYIPRIPGAWLVELLTVYAFSCLMIFLSEKVRQFLFEKFDKPSQIRNA